jgi:hypothetical protein
MPGLKDPLNRLVMGVHPFLNRAFDTETTWTQYFGAVAGRRPLIVDSWNGVPWNGCVPDLPVVAKRLMEYLERLKPVPGLIGWADDYPNTMVIGADTASGRVTDYSHFRACNDGSLSGGGRLIADYPND